MNLQILRAQIREQRKYGDILPKRPLKWVAPVTSYYNASAYEWHRERSNGTEGNLEKKEYGLFIGSQYGMATYGQCRVCGKLFNTKELRALHALSPCRDILDKVRAELQKTKRCVVCGKGTRNLGYGVPLCGNKQCSDNWKWDQFKGTATFDAAKRRVMGDRE